MLVTTLNTSIFVDLYLTLKNPFYPRENRIKYYHLFTFCYSTLIYLDIIFDITSSLLEKILLFSIIFLIMLIIPIIATVSALRRLCLRGTSQKLKNMVFRRYFVYLCIYLLIILGRLSDFTEEI